MTRNSGLGQWLVLLCVAGAFIFSGCCHREKICIDTGSKIAPCSSLNVNSSEEKFQFAIISDLHGGGRDGIFPVAVEKLNQMQPDFVMSVGDLIAGYIDDPKGINAQWDELDLMVAELEMPFFYVPGNHDITNEPMAKVWQQRMGSAYYHFVYKDVLFLCLNTEDGKPTNISDKQVEYMRKAIEDNDSVRWTFVFMHKPLWNYDNMSGFAQIEDMLSGRNYNVFAGHYHNYIMYERKGTNYYILSTTGGGSSLRGDLYGEFDHFVWLTMTDRGPVMTNIMLDGMLDHDVTTKAVSDLVSGVEHGGVVASAILVQGDVSKSASTSLKFSNPSTQQVVYTGAFECGSQVSISPESLNVTVPAGKSVELPVKLVAQGDASLEDAGMVKVSWAAAARLPERPEPVSIPGQSSICIERVQYCPRANSKVTLDGKLDEWGKLAVSMTELWGGDDDEFAPYWFGPQDASYKFAAKYDDEYLYVAAEVTDNEIHTSTMEQYWGQDALELWLDPRADPARSNSRARSNQRYVCGVSAGQTSTNAPDGFVTASVLTDSGYSVEFAIPLSYLTGQQGENWTGFRLNLVQFDHDEDNYMQLWWKPSWRSAGTHMGAGTFIKR